MASIERIHPNARGAYAPISGQVQITHTWYGHEIVTIDQAPCNLQQIAHRAYAIARDTWSQAEANRGIALTNSRECGIYAGRIKALAESIKVKRTSLSHFQWILMKIYHTFYRDPAKELFRSAKILDTLFYPDLTMRSLSGIGYIEDPVIDAVRMIVRSGNSAQKNRFYEALYQVAASEQRAALPWRWAENNCLNPNCVPQELLRRALQTMYLSDRGRNRALENFTPRF